MKNGIEVYEGYFDQVIDLPDEYADLEEKILACWRAREDADAFIDRGNWFTEQYTPAYQDDPQRTLLTGISFYKEALRSYTEERAPLQYAATQNNLGTAYHALAGYQEPTENLQRAIQAYTEALRSYTEERAPLQYAATQNNLGNAYSRLAAFLRTENHLEEAIQFFDKSQIISPLGSTALNLAGMYKQLARDNLFVKSLEEARRLIEKEDWYNLACLESLTGNNDAAIENLKHAAQKKEFDREWAWKDSDLETLHEDPRFEQIAGPKPTE